MKPFILLLLSLKQINAAVFNVAFAAGVQARVEALLTEPFTRALDPLAAAFNSGWSYVYDGEDVTTGLRNHELTNYVHDNETLAVFWILSKPTDLSGIAGFDFIYVGFENGKHFGYKLLDEVILYYMESGNSSCPEYGLDTKCRYVYTNTTSQIDGKPIGQANLHETYDPRYRPWYIAAQNGNLWSEPYVFAEDKELGITAIRKILSETNQFLGVFAVDYDLSTIDDALYNLVYDNGGDNTEYVVFVVASDGKLIASSIPGASVDTNADGIPMQVVALNCSSRRIAGVTETILSPRSEGGGGGWASANGTVLIVEVKGRGRYWAQSRKVDNAYGLHWYVVVAEPVNCDVGYFVPPGDTLAGCKECPMGGVCLGGSYLPYPEEGYWVDRQAYAYGGKLYPCVFNTCSGYKKDESTLTCWTEFGFNHSKCFNNYGNGEDQTELICREGSSGPLCGMCVEHYHYSSGSSSCLNCDNNHAVFQLVLFWTLLAVTLLVVFIVLLIRYEKKHNKKQLEDKQCLKMMESAWLVMLKYPPLNVLKHIDRGMAKVVWVTAQILSTIPWSLSVTYPDPFNSIFLSKLQYFQLDFVPWKCFQDRTNFLTKVYILSLTPIILVVIDLVVYFLRCYSVGIYASSIRLSEFGTSAGSKITSQHAYFALLLSYLVLPVCSLVQFSALTCITLQDGSSFLKSDTSIDCHSEEYKQFVAIDICLIVAYQCVPLVWLYLLWQVRHKLNPELNVDEKLTTIQDRFLSTTTMKRRSRNDDYSIYYLSFLWQDYQPTKWWFEVFEMYRRTVFVAVIPLLGGDGQLRAIFGTLLSMMMVAFLSETTPFISKITNSMLIVAQYQILFTFFVAVIISADSLTALHASNEVIGLLLICVNILIVLIVIWCSSTRLLRERKEAKWRKAISDKQLSILNECMDNIRGVEDTGTKGGALKRRSVEHILKRYILKPQDIKLEKKVGAGAFGEVFKGKCVGQPVAIKTMIDVTEASVKNFRSEILMTAVLRHPNIVNFVGACWGRDLICLVLEWVPNGTLSDFLANPSEGLSVWSQPLLRLAIDIARGMSFLQEFTYFDQVDGQEYTGVIHGDLSPNNCLVGDFSTVKIGDFGTSHALVKPNQTSCATPIFSAPELYKGNEYCEKADIYSFGMILAYLAMNGKLIDNIINNWHSKNMTLHLDASKTPYSFNGSSNSFLSATSSIASSSQPDSTEMSKVLKSIYENGWEVFDSDDDFYQCPPVVYQLISKCCSQNPSKRPSFPYIMNFLLNKCEDELSSQHSISASRNESGHFNGSFLHENGTDLNIGSSGTQDQINEYRGSEVLKQSHQVREISKSELRAPSISFKREVEMSTTNI